MTVPAFLLGRRAALAALLLVVTIVLAIGVLAVSAVVAAVETPTGDRLAQLGVLKAQAAARPQVARMVAALQLQASALPSVLHGESDAIAQAALQSELKTLVEAQGGEVRSALSLPAVSEQGLTLLSIQYDIVLPVTKLTVLAHAIESHTPYLFLTAIDVSAPQAWPSDATAPKIEVRWTVSAYRWAARR